jgi:histidine triad (HIT) family protein
MLSKKQADQIKKQLLSNLEQSKIENKEELVAGIKAMNGEQLEEFLKQNKLVKSGKEECIFCSIVDGKIDSYKVGESENALAVLDINPISKGHVIIIPKSHVENSPKQAYDLAEEMAEKIADKFSPKKVDLVPSNLFGHEIINVLPIYSNEDIHSKKHPGTSEELKKVQDELISVKAKKEKPKEEPKKVKVFTDKDTWLPRRIP